jgi:hypothetical protein
VRSEAERKDRKERSWEERKVSIALSDMVVVLILDLVEIGMN